MIKINHASRQFICKNAECTRDVKRALLTTTSKPKIVRSSFLASQFAASVTRSKSKQWLLALKESPSLECLTPVGRDFKLISTISSDSTDDLDHNSIKHNQTKRNAEKNTCYLSKIKGPSPFSSDNFIKTSAFGIDFLTA